MTLLKNRVIPYDRPYDRGGLKLPFLQGYYWAAQLRAASYRSVAAALDKDTATSKIPLYLYIYSANLATLKRHTANPFVRNTLIVWHKVFNYLGENAPLSQFSPIWGNRNFTPGTWREVPAVKPWFLGYGQTEGSVRLQICMRMILF